MNAPLSRFLTEFSAPLAEDVTFADVDAADDVPLLMLKPCELEEQIGEARREAAEAARATLEAELKAAFEEERAALLGSLEEERATWAVQQGESLSGGLTASLAQLEQTLSEALAAALKPLFSAAAQARIIAELGATLQSLLGDPAHPMIRLEGPVDLLTAFGTAHPGELSIDYVVADQTELTIIAENTRIATRLSDCVARLPVSQG